MRRYISRSLILVAALAGLMQTPAHAGLFDDDEARKALLDLRAKVDQNQHDLSVRIDKLEPGQLDLSNQIEQLREDIAKLRGEIELLNNSIATQDKRSKDYYTDLDTRLRKLEPQQVTVDGKSGSVDLNEQRSYDNAIAQFKASDFKGAQVALQGFMRDYPNSIYLPSAQYYIGAAYYALRDYRSAIAAQQEVVKTWPDNARAADAMFNIASSQADSGDKRAARKTLENLIATYPDTQAAGLAKERLLSMT
jgi:tol-pal system protein YbgF